MSSDPPFWHNLSITIKHPTFYLPQVDGKVHSQVMVNNLGKIKLYCIKCFEAHIIEIQGIEGAEHKAGKRANPPHERSDIKAECKYPVFMDRDNSEVWTYKAQTHPCKWGWILSTVSTITNHLKSYPLLDPAVQSQADGHQSTLTGTSMG